MQIFVQKGGQQLGPYTPDQVTEYLAQGSLSATDPAWHEGLVDWCPLIQIAGVVDASSSAPPAFDPETFNPNAAPPPAAVQSDVLSATPDAVRINLPAGDATCPQCQEPTKSEMLFCQTCGHDLQGDWQVKSVPHSGSTAEDDPLKQNFPKKKVLLVCGGALSLICITALLYWIFGGGINPVGTYEGMSASDPADTPELCIYTLYDNGTAENWMDGEKIEGKWELQGEEVHFTVVRDGDEITMIFQLYENRLEMIAMQMGTVRRNLPDESEGSLRGRVFVKTEGNKSTPSIASKPQDEGDPGMAVPSEPSESDLKVFRQLEAVAKQINRGIQARPPPEQTGFGGGSPFLIKVQAKIPREIHYYYLVDSFWRPNAAAETQLKNNYRRAPENEPFRREKVTKVWHYRNERGNEVAVFKAGPND